MLKAYQQDYNYEGHWNTRYKTPKEAMKYVKKLLKHFEVETKVYFDTNTKGYASHSGIYIRLPRKDISLGIIVHEVGHLSAYKKGIKGHNRKAYKYIHRVYKYSMKYIPTEILLGIDNERLLLK